MRRGTLLAAALAIAAIGGYAAYEGVEAPGNQLFGPTVVRGAANLPEVALTYDDGPNPPYTDRILDVLHTEHVPATFFLVGRAVDAYPATVRRMVREGHAVGNHSWDHAHLVLDTPARVRGDLERTSDAIERAAGVRTTLMRPPFGMRDFVVVSQARALGYQVVMWSVPLPKDWEQPGDATIARRVEPNVRDGSIIVLHDGNRGIVCAPTGKAPRALCDRSQEVGATRDIIDALRARGFTFVTVPRLLADARRAPGITRNAAR